MNRPETNPPKINITVSACEEYVLAALHGKFYQDSVDLFKEQLHPLVGTPNRRLILDLSEVDFIASAGVGAVLQLIRLARSNGSRVVIANPSSFVTEAFEIINLAKWDGVVVTRTVDEGISLLSNRD